MLLVIPLLTSMHMIVLTVLVCVVLMMFWPLTKLTLVHVELTAIFSGGNSVSSLAEYPYYRT